ncbi:MAG: hypothetical protein OEV15_02730, partial [Gallionella sp.]|nr:hypothetical protein [Gallionella sp.]
MLKRNLDFQLMGIVAALLLAGCATDTTTAATGAVSVAHAKLLQPWTELTGARPGSLSGTPVQGSYIQLRYPSAVSARINDVYLVDAGLRRIFRYDTTQQTLAQFTTVTPDTKTSIYAAPDLTVYVANPSAGQVLRFTRDGTALPTLSAPGDMARPIYVTMEEGGGRVLVADGLYDQIIVFNSLGRPLSVIKPQQLRAIGAIAAGPDGIYVVDRLDRKVVVIGWDGTFLYSFSLSDLSEPVAIAVNRDNIVFVGDKFERTVKVYRMAKTQDGAAPTAADADGIAPGSFGDISGLAVDGRKLY